MRLPDKPHLLSIERSELSARLHATLERIRTCLEVSTEEWADRLHIPLRAYQLDRFLRKGPPMDAILQLSDDLDLSLERILTGDVNYELLAAKQSGSRDVLPERYQSAAFSRRRTSINLLQYIEDHYGWREKVEILKRFQLNEAAFYDAEKRISLRFLMDLCDEIVRAGYDNQTLFRMGAYSAVTNRACMPKYLSSDIQRTSQLYELLCSGMANEFFDENFSYRLERLTHTECIISMRENPDVNDATQLRRLGNRAICVLKSGTLASLPAYLGHPNAIVRKLTCTHEGDPYCSYQVSFKDTRLPQPSPEDLH